MKAPEKLYLEDDEELFDLFPVLCLASTEKHGNEVEYIRKDAFIKKACDAYCKVCGHYAHDVPTYICRHNCDYYDDFKKHLNEQIQD